MSRRMFIAIDLPKPVGWELGRVVTDPPRGRPCRGRGWPAFEAIRPGLRRGNCSSTRFGSTKVARSMERRSTRPWRRTRFVVRI